MLSLWRSGWNTVPASRRHPRRAAVADKLEAPARGSPHTEARSAREGIPGDSLAGALGLYVSVRGASRRTNCATIEMWRPVGGIALVTPRGESWKRLPIAPALPAEM